SPMQWPRPAGIRLRGIEVVDYDEIEIGGCGHLAPAELAERQDGGLLAPHAAVQRYEILLDRALERTNEQLRQPGEGLARLLGRHGPGQDPGADQEHVLLGEDADAVENVLVRG